MRLVLVLGLPLLGHWLPRLLRWRLHWCLPRPLRWRLHWCLLRQLLLGRRHWLARRLRWRRLLWLRCRNLPPQAGNQLRQSVNLCLLQPGLLLQQQQLSQLHRALRMPTCAGLICGGRRSLLHLLRLLQLLLLGLDALDLLLEGSHELCEGGALLLQLARLLNWRQLAAS